MKRVKCKVYKNTETITDAEPKDYSEHLLVNMHETAQAGLHIFTQHVYTNT
jgi:hypothetical protein